MRRMFSLKQLQEIAKETIENAPSLELKSINAEEITGDSIIENMSGYSFEKSPDLPNLNVIYAGVCKNGNKLTFVVFGSFEKTAEVEGTETIGIFNLPSNVGEKLYPNTIAGIDNILDVKSVDLISTISTITQVTGSVIKNSNTKLYTYLRGLGSLTNGTTYLFRHEVTFLLSDNLIS